MDILNELTEEEFNHLNSYKKTSVIEMILVFTDFSRMQQDLQPNVKDEKMNVLMIQVSFGSFHALQCFSLLKDSTY